MGSHKKGQDLVEYALLVPIMLLAILAFFDFGRWVYAYTVLSNAAREGVRYASVRDNTQSTAIQNYILDRVPGLNAGAVSVTIDWSKYKCSEVFLEDGKTRILVPGRVNIQLNYTSDSILLGNLVASASSTMKIERCLP
jgi:hypothetical protein